MNRPACPSDEALLPLSTGDTVEEAVSAHYANCSDCQDRVRQVKNEISGLRRLALAGFASPALSTVAARPASERTAPEPRPLPAAIGPYRVVARLGGGGQAEVFRAVHPTLGCDVVVKLAHRSHPGETEPLLAEGRILAELDHPNLCRVYDLNLSDGHPYLVMEHIRGKNLLQYASATPLAPAQAALLVAKIARALAVAHSRGVIHDDLKPANIIIEQNGNPRVVDFGMARLCDAYHPQSTPTGGTAEFMSPEQAGQFLDPGRVDSQSDPVDQRSDLFALGAVMYYLLAHKPPFHAASLADALDRARRCDFDRTPIEAAAVPRRIARACLRAMAAEPRQRYASAADFAAGLERAVRRPIWHWALAAAAVCCAIAGAFFGIRALFPPPVDPPPVHQSLIQSIERDQPAAAPKVFTPRSPDGLQLLMPLKHRDRLILHCDVPKGYRAGVFLVDSAGKVQELSAAESPTSGSFDQLDYPASGDWILDDQSAGTLLLLVCAAPDRKPDLADVAAMVERAGIGQSAWPALPENTLFRLDRGKVEPFGEIPRSPGSAFSKVQGHLRKLRAELDARYRYYWGVALPLK